MPLVPFEENAFSMIAITETTCEVGVLCWVVLSEGGYAKRF